MKRSNWIVAAMIVAGSAAPSTMLVHSPRDGARGAAARLRFATVTPRAIATQSLSAGVARTSLGAVPGALELGPDPLGQPPVEVARRSAVSSAGVWSVSERGSDTQAGWIQGLARWHGARVNGRWTRERWELELVQRILGQFTAAPVQVAANPRG